MTDWLTYRLNWLTVLTAQQTNSMSMLFNQLYQQKVNEYFAGEELDQNKNWEI